MDDKTFDARLSDQLKFEGMERAAFKGRDMLKLARHIAREIGLECGECTADAVGRRLKSDYGIESLGPAAGSIFKTPEWQWTGEFVKSRRVKNHSRLLRVWRLVK